MPRIGKTVADIARLLAAELQGVRELRAQRKALQKELHALASEIASLKGGRIGAAPKAGRQHKVGRKGKAGRPPGRRRGAKSLRALVEEIIAKAGKPMRAKEIAAKLAESGYKTASGNLGNIVSATLAQGKNFRRVRRGLYALKK